MTFTDAFFFSSVFCVLERESRQTEGGGERGREGERRVDRQRGRDRQTYIQTEGE